MVQVNPPTRVDLTRQVKPPGPTWVVSSHWRATPEGDPTHQGSTRVTACRPHRVVWPEIFFPAVRQDRKANLEKSTIKKGRPNKFFPSPGGPGGGGHLVGNPG